MKYCISSSNATTSVLILVFILNSTSYAFTATYRIDTKSFALRTNKKLRLFSSRVKVNYNIHADRNVEASPGQSQNFYVPLPGANVPGAVRSSSSDVVEDPLNVLYNDMYYANGSGSTSSEQILKNSSGQKEQLGEFSFGSLQEVVMPVLTTSLLITANTVGAGTMILPEVAAGPGFGPTCAMFGFVYVLNLISSLLISEVAIKQHEQNCKTATSVNTLPASFKEFADAILGSEAGNAMSFVSLFINMCVLSFALMRGQEVFFGSNIGNEAAVAGAFALVLTAMTTVLDNMILSKISSLCGIVMFTAFVGVVLPALPFSVTHLDVLGTVDVSPMDLIDRSRSMLNIVPILLMLSTFQNITPTVTKLLNFDRLQVSLATIIGSGIPIVMYVMWMFVNMSGGINAQCASSNGMSDMLVSAFLMSSLLGSSIACVMSIAEEFESLLKKSSEPECLVEDDVATTIILKDTNQRQKLSFPSVILSIIPPLAAGVYFAGSDTDGAFTGALDVAGKYGATLLYGIVPFALALSQRKKGIKADDLVPGGSIPIICLGGCAFAYLAQSFSTDIMDALNSIA